MINITSLLFFFNFIPVLISRIFFLHPCRENKERLMRKRFPVISLIPA